MTGEQEGAVNLLTVSHLLNQKRRVIGPLHLRLTEKVLREHCLIQPDGGSGSKDDRRNVFFFLLRIPWSHGNHGNGSF